MAKNEHARRHGGTHEARVPLSEVHKPYESDEHSNANQREKHYCKQGACATVCACRWVRQAHLVERAKVAARNTGSSNALEALPVEPLQVQLARSGRWVQWTEGSGVGV